MAEWCHHPLVLSNQRMPGGYQAPTRLRLFLNKRNAMAATTSSGSEISDGMSTVAAASTNTITATTVNNPTAATTHGLRVLTPRFYARVRPLAVNQGMVRPAGLGTAGDERSESRPPSR